RAYGAFVSARYKNQKNLVWMMGGDMGTRPDLFDSAQTAIEQALLDGINSVAGRQSIQMSAEWTSGSMATDEATFGGSMTLNGAAQFLHPVRRLAQPRAFPPGRDENTGSGGRFLRECRRLRRDSSRARRHAAHRLLASLAQGVDLVRHDRNQLARESTMVQSR